MCTTWITSFSCCGLVVGACRPPEPRASKSYTKITSIAATVRNSSHIIAITRSSRPLTPASGAATPHLDGGADDVAAVSDTGALLCEALRAFFLRARISPGLKPPGAEPLTWLACRAAGVSEAPGVPGVWVIAAPEGAVALGPPIVPPPPDEITCAPALRQMRPAINIVAVAVIRLRMVVFQGTADFRWIEVSLARGAGRGSINAVPNARKADAIDTAPEPGRSRRPSSGLSGCFVWARASFPDEAQGDLAHRPGSPVLEQVDPLPRPQEHPACGHRDRQVDLGECGAQVSRHVIRTLVIVRIP
jgi:hypothetical protein